MSFIPASSDRDLFAVLGVMAVSMLVVGIRARGRDETPGAGAPVEGNGSSCGSEGAVPDAEASGDDDAAGGEAR
jgi:hypothetical protein